MPEFYRHPHLTAGRALDDLGAAIIDHRKILNLESSVRMRRVAQGGFARRIGSTLSKLARHTERIDAAERLPRPSRRTAHGYSFAPSRTARNGAGEGAQCI